MTGWMSGWMTRRNLNEEGDMGAPMQWKLTDITTWLTAEGYNGGHAIKELASGSVIEPVPVPEKFMSYSQISGNVQEWWRNALEEHEPPPGCWVYLTLKRSKSGKWTDRRTGDGEHKRVQWYSEQATLPVQTPAPRVEPPPQHPVHLP